MYNTLLSSATKSFLTAKILRCRWQADDVFVFTCDCNISYFIDLRREAKAIIHLQNRLSVTISAQITTKT